LQQERVTTRVGSGLHDENVGSVLSGRQRPLPRAALGCHIFSLFLAHLDFAAPGGWRAAWTAQNQLTRRPRPTAKSPFPRQRNARLPRRPPGAPRAALRNRRRNFKPRRAGSRSLRGLGGQRHRLGLL